MPGDARLGLTVGLVLVVLVAVVFFRKDPPPEQEVAVQGSAQRPTPGVPPLAGSKDSPAHAVGHTLTRAGGSAGYTHMHTVQPGDTLYSLARRYYRDPGKFVEIFLANRESLADPSVLVAGTVLTIPNLPGPPSPEPESGPPPPVLRTEETATPQTVPPPPPPADQ